MGCLSACRFSNWAQNETSTTGTQGRSAQLLHPEDAAGDRHSDDVEHQLMFAGHNAYRFKNDPFYANGFIPTVGQLVERLQTGDRSVLQPVSFAAVPSLASSRPEWLMARRKRKCDATILGNVVTL